MHIGCICHQNKTKRNNKTRKVRKSRESMSDITLQNITVSGRHSLVLEFA